MTQVRQTFIQSETVITSCPKYLKLEWNSIETCFTARISRTQKNAHAPSNMHTCAHSHTCTHMCAYAVYSCIHASI